jgi:cytochrome c-type biogenesis protein CcmH
VTRAVLLAAAVLALLAPAATAQTCPRTTLGDIEDEVMCPICGTPLGLAQEAPQAQQQRAFIEEQIADCRSKEEIKRALVAQFGEGVLALPGDESGDDDLGDVLVYAIPALALLAALGGGAIAAVRWRAAGGDDRPAGAERAGGRSGAERAGGRSGAERAGGRSDPAGPDSSRLDADLERYEL